MSNPNQKRKKRKKKKEKRRVYSNVGTFLVMQRNDILTICSYQ